MFGVGCIPWSPLARGLITRPLSQQSTRGSTDWFINRYKKGGTEDIIVRFASFRPSLFLLFGGLTVFCA